MDRPPQPSRLGADVVAVTSGRAEVLAKVLAEHAGHLGASGLGSYWAECLADGCEWVEQGDAGGMAAAVAAHRAHVAAALDAALAAQEGERGGAEVAADDGSRDPLTGEFGLLTQAALAVDALVQRVAGFSESWDRGYVQGVKDSACAVREIRGATLADSAGALRQHDAEVLRAAADDGPYATEGDRFWRAWLRERADRIAGDQ